MKRPDYLIPYDLMEAAVSGNESVYAEFLECTGRTLTKYAKEEFWTKDRLIT